MRPQLPKTKDSQRWPGGTVAVTGELSEGTFSLPNDYTLEISTFLCVSHLIPLWFLP